MICMKENSISESDLLISICNGNEQDFGKLFFNYKDLVFSIALTVTGNSFDAQEVVQDVFSRIWLYKQTLSTIGNFNAWVRTVSKNRSLTLLKKRAVELKNKELLAGHLPRATNSAEGLIQKKELQILINNAMQELSPQQRKIFELSKLDDMDRGTIAKRLGLSATTVSNHLTAALKVVRGYLFEHQYFLAFLAFILYNC